MMTTNLDKSVFKEGIIKKYFLRFHLSLILIATFCAGLLATKILLSLQVNNMPIRFPIAVIISYIAFFGFVKLWLLYISSNRDRESLSDFADFIPSPSGSASKSLNILHGGGGRFGGGGASGSFSPQINPSLQGAPTSALDIGVPVGPHDAIVETTSHPVGDVISMVGDVASSGIDTSTSIIEGLSGGLILLILGLIIMIITGIAAYVVFEAQEILIEAAFNFLLSTSLLRGLRNINAPHWTGSILRATYIPGLIVLGLSCFIAIIATKSYPQATKLSEVVRYLLAN